MQPAFVPALLPGALDWTRPAAPVRGPAGAMARAPQTSSAYGSDLALVQAALRSERAALDEFGERLACVPSFLRSLLGPARAVLGGSDFDDFCQDVFAAVWRRLDTYDGRCQLETWLWGFCRKRVLRWLERGTGGIAFGGDEQLGELQDGGAVEPGRELDLELLREELRQLERPLAEIVHLKHYDDLTFQAIGVRLRLSPNTVKSRYYRALAVLKERMASLAPGEPDR